MLKINETKKENVGAGALKSAQRGITLIALIITIIVMLILVAVTITMAVNGGLFEYAGDAAGQTRNAITDENALASGRIKIGDTWYDSPQDYVDGKVSLEQDEANNKNLIEFNLSVYINGSLESETFQAEEGMTWRQWLQSNYDHTLKGYEIELATQPFTDGTYGLVCNTYRLGVSGDRPGTGHYIRADEVIDNTITDLRFHGASLSDG